MKITFLGTRGYFDTRANRQRMLGSCCVSYNDRSVIINCGRNWLGRLDRMRADAFVLSHPDPDHAGGLSNGSPCPVYATMETWDAIAEFPISNRLILLPRTPVDICGIQFEAFPLIHSTSTPSVGYRITAGRASVFYMPDVMQIKDRASALSGVRLYIGDGATAAGSLVRSMPAAHSPIRAQLAWCRREGVPKAVFTHCGPDIVAGNEDEIQAQLNGLAQERGIKAQIAKVGMEIVLR